jgi:sugar phosphate isomerase/epimerase
VKISIISYSFRGLQDRGCLNLFGYLESVRYRYDLRAADIWNGTLASLDSDYIAEVRRELDGRDLTLACLAVDGAHIWDPDPEAREANHRNAITHLEAAERLGAQSVRIDVGGRSSDLGDEQFDCVVKRFREYAQRAHDGGYRIGPENHFGPALVPENMERIYRAVGSPAFGIMLHIGHWVDGAEEEGDRLVAPWAFHTHVDWRITTTCLQPKMEMLRATEYTGHWGIEHHTGANEYSEVAVQVAMVRDVLARW